MVGTSQTPSENDRLSNEYEKIRSKVLSAFSEAGLERDQDFIDIKVGLATPMTAMNADIDLIVAGIPYNLTEGQSFEDLPIIQRISNVLKTVCLEESGWRGLNFACSSDYVQMKWCRVPPSAPRGIDF